MTRPPEEERRTARGSAPVPPQPGVIGRESLPAPERAPAEEEPLPPPPPVPVATDTFDPSRPGSATGPTLAGPSGSGSYGAAAPPSGPVPGPARTAAEAHAGVGPGPAPPGSGTDQGAMPAASKPRQAAATATGPDLAGQTLTGPATGQAAAAAATVATSAASPFAGGPSAGGPVALPDADRRDPGGGDSQPLSTAARAPSGRMPRLRVGWHTVPTAALSALTVLTPPSGLVLGADRRRDPVAVRLFAPEPTRVALVGGAWPAYLVVLRALALGARITVVTADPANWAAFGGWAASGPGDQVTVLGGEQPLALVGTPQRPALIVYDLGVAGPRAAAHVGPWQSQLTVLRRLDRPGVGVVQESSLTLLQRLDATEALIAGSALRLPPHSGRFLQVMADDMLAVVADSADRYIWVTPTPTELQYAGPARR